MEGVIVFDMDGVLVDVSESYRETIRETVEHFGGPDDLARAHPGLQELGRLEQRLGACRRRSLPISGIESPYEHVVREFNEIFFGENNDGLILREKWIADPAMLERLARRICALHLHRAAAIRSADHADAFRATDSVVDDRRRRQRREVKAGAGWTARYRGASIRTCRSRTWAIRSMTHAAREAAGNVRFVGIAHRNNPRREELVALLQAARRVAGTRERE